MEPSQGMAFNRRMPELGDAPANIWTAVIPIRSFSEGKTRLHVSQVSTTSLIEAFAHDVISACKACAQIAHIIVVSPDPAVVTLAQRRGCQTHVEHRVSGINEAIMAARSKVDGPVMAILGDTPCVDASVLSAVIDEASQHAVSFVSDTSGVGSTMWFAHHNADERPHFGPHSRAEHRSHGAAELGVGNATELWARARRDVDTDIDLWDAARLGLGPTTAALLDVERGRT